MDILIIGAGPAGNYLAYLLAKNKINVDVYEEHKKIGIPIQCTGILTSSINNIIKIKKDAIANKISCFKLISPNNNCIEFNFKHSNIIVHRDKFDLQLSKMAKAAGAKYHLDTKYISNSNNTATLRNNSRIITKKFDYLIGADGPNSDVAKNNRLFAKRKFTMGQQIIAKLSLPENEIQIYLGIGEFAWLVPEGNNIFRIGLIAKENSRQLFESFLRRLEKQHNKKIKPIQNRSGIIPMFNPKQLTHKNNIFLVGDSATQVKATSYGGIIHGLLASQCIAEKIIKKQKYSAYDKSLKSKVTKDLYYSLLIRNILNRFNENDYNNLIKTLNKKQAVSLLEEYDRDFPSKFALKLLLAQPKLLKFSKKLIF